MKYDQIYRSLLAIEGEAGAELHSRCPFHADTGKRSFSANVRTGKWKCFAKCGGGSFKSFCKKAKAIPALAASLAVLLAGGSLQEDGEPGHTQDDREVLYVPAQEVKENQTHFNSKRGTLAKKWLNNERHISSATAKRFGLGLSEDGIWITIPHTDEQGTRNLKCYDFLKATNKKYKNYGSNNEYSFKDLWPRGVVEKHQQILLLEGEMDTMLAHELGLDNTVTVTGGAGTWEDSFTRALEGKQVVICYDIDEAGLAGANKIANLLSAKTDVRIAKLPMLEPKNADFTDYMKKVKWDVRVFIESVMGPALEDKNKPVRTSLNGSSQPEIYGKKISLRAVVAGKDLTPFAVPRAVAVDCAHSDDNGACAVCPLKAYRGKMEAEIPETSKPVIFAPDSTDGMVEKELKDFLGIPGRCPGSSVTVTRTVPLWDSVLTNDIEERDGKDFQQFTQRRAFSLVELEPNVPYEMDAISTKDPKTQAALIEVIGAKTSQTSLESFTIKGKEHLLKLWRP